MEMWTLPEEDVEHMVFPISFENVRPGRDLKANLGANSFIVSRGI
jgi:hypothetical protein